MSLGLPFTRFKVLLGICKPGGILRKSLMQSLVLLGDRPPELVLEDDFSRGASVARLQQPSLLLLDWDLALVKDRTAFLQRFRRTQGCRTTPIIICAQDITKQVIAVASEYNVDKVISAANVENEMPTTLKNLVAELKNPSLFQRLSMILDDAIERNVPQDIEDAVLEMYDNCPDEPRSQVEFAIRALKLRHFDEARNIAQQVLNFYKEDTRAMTLLARLNIRDRKLKEAVNLLNTAEVLSPSNLERLIILGELYRDAGKMENAKSYFQIAIQTDPGSKEALAGLAILCLLNDKSDEIPRIVREKLTPEEFSAVYSKSATLASRNSNFELAVPLFEEALKRSTQGQSRARILFNLALAFQHLGRLSEAREHLVKVLMIDPTLTKAQKFIEEIDQVLKPHHKESTSKKPVYQSVQSGIPPPFFFDHEEDS